MNLEMLWNLGLTVVLAFIGWWAKTIWAELQRVQIQISKTREEMAKEYITKTDVHTDINRVLHRLDNLDAKLERYFAESRWDGHDRRA